MSTRSRWVAFGLAVVAALAGSTSGAGAAPARRSVAVEVAPYVEPTSPHAAALLPAVRQHELHQFTVAFVLGRGCRPTWDDYSPITGTDAGSKLVARARAAGAVPIVSFGGQSGHELATVCTSRRALVAAYAAVVRRLHATSIDFDIEGASRINDKATNARRFAAIRALERRWAHLRVSLTIPVDRSGILGDRRYGDALALLRLAKARGARIDVVNLMTMNYGSPVDDMAAAATIAARHALPQLRRIWPGDGYRNLGITPMIGANESPGETFSYADAQRVVAFAHAHHVGRLAFWSLNRDRSCGPHDTAPETCSGMSQHALDFTDAFLG
jgi:hypothetical protein